LKIQAGQSFGEGQYSHCLRYGHSSAPFIVKPAPVIHHSYLRSSFIPAKNGKLKVVNDNDNGVSEFLSPRLSEVSQECGGGGATLEGSRAYRVDKRVYFYRFLRFLARKLLGTFRLQT